MQSFEFEEAKSAFESRTTIRSTRQHARATTDSFVENSTRSNQTSATSQRFDVHFEKQQTKSIAKKDKATY